MWCIIKQPEAKVAALIIQGNKQRAMTEHYICFSLHIWLSHMLLKEQEGLNVTHIVFWNPNCNRFVVSLH